MASATIRTSSLERHKRSSFYIFIAPWLVASFCSR